MTTRPQESAETEVAAGSLPNSPRPTKFRALEFRLLGPLEVRRGGELIILGGARQRALLALLCLRPGTIVAVDRIVDELWGGSPLQTARHIVEVYVSKLRMLLGADTLATRTPGYCLQVESENIDVASFERLLSEGRDAFAVGETALAASVLADALGLWRGSPLADFVYEPFAQAEIARLEELRLLAQEERIEAELALGQREELVAELKELIAEAPFLSAFAGNSCSPSTGRAAKRRLSAPIGTRVFVSSTLAELAEERAAVARAISALRLTPVLFELGARPHPPRELYRAYDRVTNIGVISKGLWANPTTR